MLNAKRLGRPLFPILCHAGIHAVLMAIAFWGFGFSGFIVIKMFFVQLLLHFFIDTWKGLMNTWFPVLQSPANKWHWVVFGFDQFLHAIVIIVMVSVS